MDLVNISDAILGQVLARDVTNAAGVVLCPAGMILTPAIIEHLKRAGIEAVLLNAGEESRPSGPTIEQRLEALETRFAGVEDPILLQLKAAVEKRLKSLQLKP